MEKYSDIRYQFDVPTVHRAIEQQLAGGKPGYICAADGNILAMVCNDREYRNVINGSMFSICDSSWVPKFVKWIYGYKRNHYCGSDIFKEPKKQIKRYWGFFDNPAGNIQEREESKETEQPLRRDTKFIVRRHRLLYTNK